MDIGKKRFEVKALIPEVNHDIQSIPLSVLLVDRLAVVFSGQGEVTSHDLSNGLLPFADASAKSELVPASAPPLVREKSVLDQGGHASSFPSHRAAFKVV